jgi:ATP adenylyltransferase
VTRSEEPRLRVLHRPHDRRRAAADRPRRPLAYVILNKFPYNAGHLMVVPHRHVAQLAALETRS